MTTQKKRAEEMNKQARIKDGAIIGCDMHQVAWKDEGEVFEVFPLIEGKVRLIAPHYGGEPYGNGPLYVKIEDLILSSKGVKNGRSNFP